MVRMKQESGFCLAKLRALPWWLFKVVLRLRHWTMQCAVQSIGKTGKVINISCSTNNGCKTDIFESKSIEITETFKKS